MKQIKTKSGEILIAEVPEDIDLDTLSYSTSQDLHLLTATGKDVDIYCNNIPDIKLIGILSELTDKDCEEFVENTVRCNNCNWEDCEDNLKTFVDMSEHIGKEIYYYKGCPNCETDDYLMDISKESFVSLLKSEGIDTSKELLIIKIL